MISTIIVQSIGMYLGKINVKSKNVMNLAFLTSFLILTCPILAPSVLADTNLVLNPDLESGTTVPSNWTFVNQGANTPIWDSVSHSGSKSIKISVPGTTDVISGYPQSDLIDAQPLTTYTASVWGKTQNTGGSNTPAARVVELDADKNWIRQNNILPVFGRGTNDWTQRTIEFQTAANTRYLYVYANIWNGYGNFWMDDVELKLKDRPTPTITPTPSPTPSGSCYVIPGGVPSSMKKYVGKTVCANCGHHRPIPSTWKPCGTPTPTVTATPTITPPPISGSTIAYLGDARPSKFGTAGITELTKDLNQVVPQSPTGKVDAIFMIGDMDKISQTQQAYYASNVKNIPIFFVVGNHEVATSGDVAAIKAMTLKMPVNKGPTGTEKTTYSVDVGGIHVVNMNEYWDGKTNDAYGSGYVPEALYNWMNTDLSSTTNYKIVLGHEPLYPKKRHVGDSLDANTANRDKLQNLFVSQKVSVFVGAHTHYATVNTVGGVYHVDAGISGKKTVDGEDPYASIFYTHTTENNLVLTWKHENPTWTTPKIATYTISK